MRRKKKLKKQFTYKITSLNKKFIKKEEKKYENLK